MSAKQELAIIFKAIQEARKNERERCAELLEEAAVKLYGGKARITQVDAHTAQVLRDFAESFRGME